MADYGSDSSGSEDSVTNVLLGYASREPTSDDFSQLGGHATWLDQKTAPNGTLSKCKVCNGLLNLLLQLNGDIRERFPGHERRLYICACRRKACRRKEGSVRGFRAVRVSHAPAAPLEEQASDGAVRGFELKKPQANLGETLFGVKLPKAAQANHSAVQSSNTGGALNPFAAATLARQPPATEALTQTFAQKARISSPTPPKQMQPPFPQEPWPNRSSFPQPYKSYHVDADQEYLDTESNAVPSNARLDRSAASGQGNSSAADDKVAFESSMDRTFQRFADRVAQNPEQILRYEFDGQPLLYSKSDAVGKLLSPAMEQANVKVKTVGNGHSGPSIPKCTNCGARRVFELQLTPHAITELEANDMNIDGMDWGTILFGVCSADCEEVGKEGEVGYVEEWVGAQWEELAEQRRP